MKHADLIARLEKLTGPDREADAEIARLTGWSPTGGIPATGAPSYWYSSAFGMPAFTASLDAAIALVGRVLPGCGIDMATYPDRGRAEAMFRNPPTKSTFANTLPIALVIALLRALHDPAARDEAQ